MRAKQYIQIAIAWSNPYTAPDTGPRILWAATLLDRKYEDEALKHAPSIQSGCGYSITIGFLPDRVERCWSPEAKAQARSRNLRRQLDKQVPLFADELEARERFARPDNFDPVAIAKDDEAMKKFGGRGNETFWFDAFVSPARPFRDIQAGARI